MGTDLYFWTSSFPGCAFYRYHWVNSAQATNHTYADAGIFGVSGSAEPVNLRHLIRVLAAELRFTATSSISDLELQRAKNQLESMLLMNMEMNPVVFEDIARQLLASGEWKPPAYWVEKISTLNEYFLNIRYFFPRTLSNVLQYTIIDAVTADDLQHLVIRMLKSPITLVGYGRMDKFPQLQEIQEEIAAPLETHKTYPSFFKRFL